LRLSATPGCPTKGRPGVLVLAVALAAVLACAESDLPGGEAAELEIGDETVRLEPGVQVVDVLLRFRTASAVPIEPDTIRIRPGDIVRIVTGDSRPHAVVFDADRLTPDARAFLERTGQLRGPPLIQEGAAWVLSFEGAPPGAYPFVDLSQDVGGLVVVAAPPQAR